ncbi:helix-turn-helix transcriptional regulator [Brochothrix thermosphacta]|uniref:helix-turn-helix transcriptional regulator n=1 Tax=Brochothrix thermosphacta TaxID=2756 RepID=UPI0003E86227|nr:helix-turn-helix transcriptional regulator [Brochothrix thermosphacta]EUJ36663.1 transcriptional regulator [Brochothrix thermosphacta DSM 20171 = FSL F6-1036]
MKVTLKGLRGNVNLTQKQMAEKLAIHKETWRNYETGASYPDVKVIRKIESVFGVKYDDIIFLTDITVKPLDAIDERHKEV